MRAPEASWKWCQLGTALPWQKLLLRRPRFSTAGNALATLAGASFHISARCNGLPSILLQSIWTRSSTKSGSRNSAHEFLRAVPVCAEELFDSFLHVVRLFECSRGSDRTACSVDILPTDIASLLSWETLFQ